MGNRAGRRAQPNPSPAYGGAYAPYNFTSDYPSPRPPYQANYRRQCYAYPQRRPYY